MLASVGRVQSTRRAAALLSATVPPPLAAGLLAKVGTAPRPSARRRTSSSGYAREPGISSTPSKWHTVRREMRYGGMMLHVETRILSLTCRRVLCSRCRRGTPLFLFNTFWPPISEPSRRIGDYDATEMLEGHLVRRRIGNGVVGRFSAPSLLGISCHLDLIGELGGGDLSILGCCCAEGARHLGSNNFLFLSHLLSLPVSLRTITCCISERLFLACACCCSGLSSGYGDGTARRSWRKHGADREFSVARRRDLQCFSGPCNAHVA